MVELVIAKHRNGQQGRVPLIWKGEYTTFVSVNRDRNEESLEKSAPPDYSHNKENEKEEEVIQIQNNSDLDGIF